MEEKISIHLYEPESQEVFGEKHIKITAIIKDAEKIVQQTDGKVYFTDEGLDYRSGYFDVKDSISENLKEITIAQVKKTGEKEVTIYPEQLNWAQISKVIKKCEEKIKEEEEQERVKQIDTMLRQKFKHIKVYGYSNEVIFTIDEPIKKLNFRDYDDLLQKISELTEEKVMLEYIQKLQEKCRELEKRCEEIEDVKRYHEEEDKDDYDC